MTDAQHGEQDGYFKVHRRASDDCIGVEEAFFFDSHDIEGVKDAYNSAMVFRRGLTGPRPKVCVEACPGAVARLRQKLPWFDELPRVGEARARP